MGASAVLYPTLYEGFGLPALEAQAVGTPVIFSDVNGLSELSGPGAMVVPLHDMEAWLSATRSALARSAGADRINGAARRWATAFSWQVYADRVLDVCRSAAGRRHVRRAAAAAL
jgi:glycosyltransferase involved in cell wall biosynthesis